jgi:glycosyltransferase involved in cell wall biosynthesis
MSPTISVVMPVFNGEKYLQEAIQSILDQSFRDFELIIVDDLSTDHSVEVIKKFNDPRIKFYTNEQNQRISRTLNRGIQAASGKYIARMDQDDVALTNRLEVQKQFLDQNPKISIVGSWTKIMSEEGIVSDRKHVHYTDPNELKFWFQFNCFLVHPSTFFRKEVWETLGGYAVDADRQPEDFDFWTMALHQFEMVNLPEVLLHYRESKKSMSRGNRDDFEKHLEKIGTNYIAFLQNDPDHKNMAPYRKYFQIGNHKRVPLTLSETLGLLWINQKSVFSAADRKLFYFFTLYFRTRTMAKAILKQSTAIRRLMGVNARAI